MNKMQFTIELAKALAWPVTIIVGIILLKKDVGSLFPRLERFKHKDTELEFSSAFQKIQEEASSIDEEGKDLDVDLLEKSNRLKEFAEFAPKSVIHQAWSLVDSNILELIRRKIPREKRSPLKIGEMYNILEELGLSDQLIGRIKDLRKTRYISTRRRENTFTKDQIYSYIELAIDVTSSLEKMLID